MTQIMKFIFNLEGCSKVDFIEGKSVSRFNNSISFIRCRYYTYKKSPCTSLGPSIYGRIVDRGATLINVRWYLLHLKATENEKMVL